MRFDGSLYYEEMMRLVRGARSAVEAEFGKTSVYTISIWTDPDAARSSISIDTVENSTCKLAKLTTWAREQSDRARTSGDEETADLLLRLPDRNRNPADFALIDLVEVEHRSFDSDWGTRSNGGCWAILAPALERVAREAREIFADLTLEQDALLGVNTSDDWFGKTWILRPASSQCRCVEFLRLPETWQDVETRFLVGDIIRPTLERISTNPSTWMRVSRCRVCGRIWAGEYPLSEQQGGGPELLYTIDVNDPSAWLSEAAPLATPLRRRHEDRGFFAALPPEIGPDRCREPDCTRLHMNPGLFCRCHHFEMVMQRPCPFWDE